MLARYYRDPYLCVEQETQAYTYYRHGHPEAEGTAALLSGVEGSPCLLFASGMSALASYLWTVRPRRVYLPYPVYPETEDLAVRYCALVRGRVLWSEPRSVDREGVVLVDSVAEDLETFRGFVLRPAHVRRMSRYARVVVDVTRTCPSGHPDFLRAGAEATWASLAKYLSAGMAPGGVLWVPDPDLRSLLVNNGMRLLGGAFAPSPVLEGTIGSARWLRERCSELASAAARILRRAGFRVLCLAGLVHARHVQTDVVQNLAMELREAGLPVSRHYGTHAPSFLWSAQRGEIRLHPGVDESVLALLSGCVDRVRNDAIVALAVREERRRTTMSTTTGTRTRGGGRRRRQAGGQQQRQAQRQQQRRQTARGVRRRGGQAQRQGVRRRGGR